MPLSAEGLFRDKFKVIAQQTLDLMLTAGATPGAATATLTARAQSDLVDLLRRAHLTAEYIAHQEAEAANEFRRIIENDHGDAPHNNG